MIKNRRIAIIGAGNIGSSIALGLAKSGIIATANITVTRRHIDKIQNLADEGMTVTSDNKLAVESSDIIIIAVKPWRIETILKEILPSLNPEKHSVASVVTGYTLKQMQETTGLIMPMFRIMPNTAIAIQESMTFISGNGVSIEAENEINHIFKQLGDSITIDEELQQAATVLGSCGIAFAMRYIRAASQGGIQIGFDADTAQRITTQTVKGASCLLLERGQHPEHEIDKVTTPQGFTITGLNEMEHRGFSSSLIKGISESFRLIPKNK